MEPLDQASVPNPKPPVVGTVTHHSIELYWKLDKNFKREGNRDQWFRFSIEKEDNKTHTYDTIYTGYARRYIVEDLQPNASYRFRLKVTSPAEEYAYSSVVTVSTTREPKSGEDLHRAVNMNDEEAVVKILQSGYVNIDVPDKLGFTALMVAAQKGYARLVSLLIERGADVNKVNGSGKNSLMLACFAGHLDIVKYLRTHGLSWEARDMTGSTAMHWAADGGHLEVIEWMIMDGSKVAALNNHERLVDLLLEKGADPCVTNEYGKTIIEMARAFGRQNVVALLVKMKK